MITAKPRMIAAAMLPLLLLTFWLGARSLQARTIWYDEWWTIFYAGSAPQYGPAPLAETWRRVADTDHELNPPGYYLAINVWSRLVGDSPYTLRVWSLLLGMLALAFVYRAGRDLLSPWAGVSAALALGLSSFFVQYLYEGRAYMQMALCTAAVFWAYWRLTTGRRITIGLGGLFVVSLAGLLYTHYMAIFVVAALGLYHLLFVGKDARWWGIVLLAGLALAAFVPWVSVALKAFNQVTNDPARDAFAADAFSLLRRLIDLFSNGSAALLAIFAWYALPGRRVVWFTLIVALSFVLAINAVFRFVTDVHYLLALWPLLALVVGLGAARMAADRLRPWVPLSLWVIAGLITSLSPEHLLRLKNETFALYLPWDLVARQMARLAQPGDALIFFLPEPVPNWLHQPVSDYYLEGLPVRRAVVDSPADKPVDKYRREAETFVDDAPRVWIARQPNDPPLPVVDAEFQRVFAERRYVECGSPWDAPDLRLTLYVRALERAAATFGEAITAYLPLDPLPVSSGRLSVALGWEVGETTPPNTYSVGVHLDDPNGQLARQYDYGLPPQGFTCRSADIPLDGLPPGDYRLLVTVYNWQTGERLPGTALASGQTGDRLPLATVRVGG